MKSSLKNPFNIYMGENEKGEKIVGFLTMNKTLDQNNEFKTFFGIIDEKTFSIQEEVKETTLRRFTGLHDSKENRIFDGQRVLLKREGKSYALVLRWNNDNLQYGYYPANKKTREISNHGEFIKLKKKDKTLALQKYETPRTLGLNHLDLKAAVPTYNKDSVRVLKEGFREPRKEKENIFLPNRKTPILTNASYKAVVHKRDRSFERLFPNNEAGEHLYLGDIIQFTLIGMKDFKIGKIISVPGGYAVESPDGTIRVFGKINKIYVIGHIETSPAYFDKDINLDFTGVKLHSENEVFFTIRGDEKFINTFYDRKDKKYISPYFIVASFEIGWIEWPEKIEGESVKFEIKDLLSEE